MAHDFNQLYLEAWLESYMVCRVYTVSASPIATYEKIVTQARAHTESSLLAVTEVWARADDIHQL